MHLIFGPPPLGEKAFYDFTNVSISVGKRVFSKTSHRISLKFLLKLGSFKGKKLTELYRKKSQFGDNAQHTPKTGFFEFCKKNWPKICRFFGFKLCTIMTFMILLKTYIWEKYGFWVKCKNALDQSDCKNFKL